jgi:hypothetical protein
MLQFHSGIVMAYRPSLISVPPGNNIPFSQIDQLKFR